MKGQRIPVPENGDIFTAVENAGDYCGPAEGTIPNPMKDGPPIPVRRVAFLLPIARAAEVHGGLRSVCHCQEPPHKFTEEPDGSLTITESILVTACWKDEQSGTGAGWRSNGYGTGGMS